MRKIKSRRLLRAGANCTAIPMWPDSLADIEWGSPGPPRRVNIKYLVVVELIDAIARPSGFLV